jgi:proline-specific peptidase
MSKIKNNGTTLYVKVIGNGYPILLMHGGPGVDHSTLLPLLPLANQFTLIFYDHRCNGRSESTDITTMTWENLSIDAESLRESLGFEQWAVLGHSFGGMVALEYALHFPQSISHLILMDTCADSNWVRNNASRVLMKRGYSSSTVKAAQKFFTGKVNSIQMLTYMLRFGKAYYYKPSIVRLFSEILASLRIRRNHKAFVYGFSKLLVNWTVMDRLNEIICPTMILAGRYDFQFPFEHQSDIAKRISNSRLNIIENSGHNVQKEKPDEIMNLIREFVLDD